jgi:hypothetical protein
MDATTLELISQLSSNLSVVAILLLVAYRLSVALATIANERDKALERYIEHLERFHPPPPPIDN